jgi:nitrous oxide reductase
MSIAFQIMTPGVNFDLSHAGKGPSDGWFFFSCYNTEQAYSLLEVNASQRDKDFIMAVNWKKAEQYAKEGKGKRCPANITATGTTRAPTWRPPKIGTRTCCSWTPRSHPGPVVLHALPQEPARLRCGSHRQIHRG